MVLEYSALHPYLHAFNLCTQLAVTLIKIRTQLECLVRGAGAAEKCWSGVVSIPDLLAQVGLGPSAYNIARDDVAARAILIIAAPSYLSSYQDLRIF